jgi:two-component system chemotaxis sensor kinase CheA
LTGIHQRLAAIFQGEHAEHLQHIRSILALLENVEETKGRAEIDEAFRRAHSLKGAARAVDLDSVEGIASGLETLFSRVRDGTLPLDRQAIRVILGALEASEDCIGAFRESRVPDEPAAALRAIDNLLGIENMRESAVPAPARVPTSAVAAPPPPVEIVRLPSENLDRLVRSTSQILTESLRQAGVSGDIEQLDGEAAEWAAECARFRRSSSAPLRRLANQPEYSSIMRHLELAEQKAQSLASRSRAASLLQKRSARNTQRLAAQLQLDLWSARMAPAEDLFEGFRKMVRDLAREEKKEIDFRQNGSGVRADRIVLQALKDPVMHLLRNAISHGIETPAERARAGKSPVASLILRLDSQGGRLIVEVEDDGRGIDMKKVDSVLSQSEPGAHSPEQLARVIFQPGFSTSPTVNRLSGRGMGLSVVYETVHRLQGEVNVRPKEGPGAAFLLSVPLSVSTSHLVLLACAGQTFGVPSHGIERLCRIPHDWVQTLEGNPVVKLDEKAVPLYGLAHLLQIRSSESSLPPGGDASPLPAGKMLNVMVLRSGSGRFAVWVDEFLAERDAMIESLGMPSPATGNVSGGALMRDGTVVVVLNPAGLAASCTPSSATRMPQAAGTPAQTAPCILVVDDSITSRSLEKSILEAHGYRVRVAIDGVEALESLRAEKVDLIVTDIQMPRLGGFGLLEALKADSELNRIPVIVVSSLEGTEDRERGLLLGADGYLSKHKFDQTELLDAIRQMI